MSSTMRTPFATLLQFEVPAGAPAVVAREEVRRDGYRELAVSYAGEEGPVPALLLVPDDPGAGAVVAHHQHHAQWHYGKSEVAGLCGDPLQAFGPALARRGVTVLAPDAIGFEDRRESGPGTHARASDPDDYFATMGHRLVEGRPLMSSVLADAAVAHSVLAAQAGVDPQRVGALGHSMGGATVLWHTAIDRRVAFAAASGCACTYRDRISRGVGIDAAQAIPSVLKLGDLDAVALLAAPRPLLIVSAEEDKYSRDAPAIVEAASRAYSLHRARDALRHLRYRGGHALTEERFEAIVEWVASRAAA